MSHEYVYTVKINLSESIVSFIEKEGEFTPETIGENMTSELKDLIEDAVGASDEDGLITVSVLKEEI